MWPFSHKKKVLTNQQLLDDAKELRSEFDELDFDNIETLRSLGRRCGQQATRLTRALSALEAHLERIDNSINSYDERMATIKTEEQALAEQIQSLQKEAAEKNTRKLSSQIFSATRKLLSIQNKRKIVEREYKDYSLTEQTVRAWVLNITDCLSVLEMMSSSVERNIERLSVSEILHGNKNGEQIEEFDTDGVGDILSAKDIKLKQKLIRKKFKQACRRVAGEIKKYKHEYTWKYVLSDSDWKITEIGGIWLRTAPEQVWPLDRLKLSTSSYECDFHRPYYYLTKPKERDYLIMILFIGVHIKFIEMYRQAVRDSKDKQMACLDGFKGL
jgi:hypothetical protein